MNELIIAAIGVLGVAVGGIVTGLFAYRRNTADAKETEDRITERVLKRAEESMIKMQARIEELEHENSKLRSENTELRKRIRELEQRMTEH